MTKTYVACNKATMMPVLFLEGHYEDESGHGGNTGTPNTLRHQRILVTDRRRFGRTFVREVFGWTVFDPAWQSHLNSQADDRTGLFQEFLNWHPLVRSCARPDRTRLLTAGYGTLQQHGNSRISQVDYATAAKTADGSLAVIYTPVAHTLTVAMGNFAVR